MKGMMTNMKMKVKTMIPMRNKRRLIFLEKGAMMMMMRMMVQTLVMEEVMKMMRRMIRKKMMKSRPRKSEKLYKMF